MSLCCLISSAFFVFPDSIMASFLSVLRFCYLILPGENMPICVLLGEKPMVEVFS